MIWGIITLLAVNLALGKGVPPDPQPNCDSIASLAGGPAFLALPEMAANRGAREFYWDLSRKANFSEIFAELDRVQKQYVESYLPPDSFEYYLAKFAEQIKTLPHESVKILLSEYAKAYEAKAKVAEKTNRKTMWSTSDVLPLIENYTKPARVALKDKLSEDGPVSQHIADSVFLYDTAEVRTMLKKFQGNEQLAQLHELDQGAIFYCLARALHKASKSEDKTYGELLRNTVEVVVADWSSIELVNLVGGASGEHAPSVIRIDRHLVIDPRSPLFRRSEKKADEMIGVIAHEVSHLISPWKQSTKGPGYFEEEMRAHMVGFYAEHGKPITLSEAIDHANYLLNYGGDNGVYNFISRAFQNDPASFAQHIQQLNKLTPTVPSVPAPEWGWNGFLTNRPPPKESIVGNATVPKKPHGKWSWDEYVATVPRLTYIPSDPRSTPSKITERFEAVRIKLTGPYVKFELGERLVEAAQSLVKYEELDTPFAEVTRQSRMKIVTLTKNIDANFNPAEAERLLDVHRAITHIATMYAGLLGAKENPEIANIYSKLIMNPAHFDAFVGLGKAGSRWLYVSPINSFEKALTRIAPAIKSLSTDQTNALLGAFSTAYTARAVKGEIQGEPWKDLDTDGIIKPFIASN